MLDDFFFHFSPTYIESISCGSCNSFTSLGSSFSFFTLFCCHNRFFRYLSWQQMPVVKCITAMFCLFYVSDDPCSIHVKYRDTCLNSNFTSLLRLFHVFLFHRCIPKLSKIHASSIYRQISRMVPIDSFPQTTR